MLWGPAVSAVAETHTASAYEFSGTIVRQVNGKKSQAQVFAKGDRLRLEYKYAIRTAYGYAAIEIIRLDRAEAWYLLAQRKELLVAPLDPDDVLPMHPVLPENAAGRWLARQRRWAGSHSSMKSKLTGMVGWNSGTSGSMQRGAWSSSLSAAIVTGRSPMNGSDGLRNRWTTSMHLRGTESGRLQAFAASGGSA